MTEISHSVCLRDRGHEIIWECQLSLDFSLSEIGTSQHCIISKSVAGDICFNSCSLHCCIPTAPLFPPWKSSTDVCDKVNLTLHRRLRIQFRLGVPKCLYPSTTTGSITCGGELPPPRTLCELCTADSLIAAGSLCFKTMSFERVGLAHSPMLCLYCFILKRLGDI